MAFRSIKTISEVAFSGVGQIIVVSVAVRVLHFCRRLTQGTVSSEVPSRLQIAGTLPLSSAWSSSS